MPGPYPLVTANTLSRYLRALGVGNGATKSTASTTPDVSQQQLQPQPKPKPKAQPISMLPTALRGGSPRLTGTSLLGDVVAPSGEPTTVEMPKPPASGVAGSPNPILNAIMQAVGGLGTALSQPGTQNTLAGIGGALQGPNTRGADFAQVIRALNAPEQVALARSAYESGQTPTAAQVAGLDPQLLASVQAQIEGERAREAEQGLKERQVGVQEAAQRTQERLGDKKLETEAARLGAYTAATTRPMAAAGQLGNYQWNPETNQWELDLYSPDVLARIAQLRGGSGGDTSFLDQMRMGSLSFFNRLSPEEQLEWMQKMAILGIPDWQALAYLQANNPDVTFGGSGSNGTGKNLGLTK